MNASLLTNSAPEQGKIRRRVSELQVLAVCLVHAIYEASKDSLKETLNILPPYSIASVVAVSPYSSVFFIILVSELKYMRAQSNGS